MRVPPPDLPIGRGGCDTGPQRDASHEILRLALVACALTRPRPDEMSRFASTHAALSSADAARFELDGYKHQGGLRSFSSSARAVVRRRTPGLTANGARTESGGCVRSTILARAYAGMWTRGSERGGFADQPQGSVVVAPPASATCSVTKESIVEQLESTTSCARLLARPLRSVSPRFGGLRRRHMQRSEVAMSVTLLYTAVFSFQGETRASDAANRFHLAADLVRMTRCRLETCLGLYICSPLRSVLLRAIHGVKVLAEGATSE